MKTYLGIELGSTRIKATVIDGAYAPVAEGDYTWKSAYENGVWTYSLDEVWKGLKAALSGLGKAGAPACMGVSAMMHGYLAFDKDWNLLVPFRTWQNTITGPAAAELTELLGFNIPQRWSVAHLYQAVLNGEEHVSRIAHLTTLAGYVHYMLTGVNAVGVGEASGMFPVDPDTLQYDAGMMEKFDALTSSQPWRLADLLPAVLPAGAPAGTLTAEGAGRLGGLLPPGIPLCPPEGDAGTGMTATNSVAPRTGNVSAGTSVFSMVVLEKPLNRVYPEIDIVATPAGKPVAMVHCNNCTNDMNAWVELLREFTALLGRPAEPGDIYPAFYRKALEGDPDCGGLLLYNYLAGEPVSGVEQGRPMLLRSPESRFTLANFCRASIYSALSTLKIGMDILAEEHVAMDRLMGHGGLFRNGDVGARFLAAAAHAPVQTMKTAAVGGPYGMALLACYAAEGGGLPLERFLEEKVFAGAEVTTTQPDAEDEAGFGKYLEAFKAGLPAERAAASALQ